MNSLLRIFCLASLSAFAWSMPDASVAQSSSILKVTARTLSNEVGLDRSIPVEVVLSNTSEADRIALRGNPEFSRAGGLEMWLVDESGQRTRILPSRSEQGSEGIATSERKTVIPPQTSLGLQQRLRLKDVISRAGRYQLIVSYATPSPAATEQDQRDISEGLRAESEPLVLEVYQ